MEKNRLSMLLVFALCFVLLMSFITFSQNQSKLIFKNYNATADDKQIEILQELYLQDISLGELIEQVYPKALEHIPENVLKNIYEEKVQW